MQPAHVPKRPTTSSTELVESNKRQCLVPHMQTPEERRVVVELWANHDFQLAEMQIRLENERLIEDARMQGVRLAEEARMKEVRLVEEGRLRLLDADQRTVYLREALRPRDEYAGLLDTVQGRTTRDAWSDTLRVVLGAPANVKSWRPKAEQKTALVDRLRRYAQQRLLQSVPSDVQDRHLLHWMALSTEDNVMELLRSLQTAVPPPPAPVDAVAVVAAPLPMAQREFIYVTEAANRAQRNLADWPAPAAHWLPQIRRKGLVHAFQYLWLDAIGGPVDRLLVHAEELQMIVRRGMVTHSARGKETAIRPRATCIVTGIGAAFELLFWSREHRDRLRAHVHAALGECAAARGLGSAIMFTGPRGVLAVPELAAAMRDALSLGRILARRQPKSVTEWLANGSLLVVPRRTVGEYELWANQQRAVWMVRAGDSTDEDRVLPVLPTGVYNVPRTAAELTAALGNWSPGPDTCTAWVAVLRDPALLQTLLDALHADPDPFLRLMLRLNWRWLTENLPPPGIATTGELVTALRDWVPAPAAAAVVPLHFTETVAADGAIVLHCLQTELDAEPHLRDPRLVAFLARVQRHDGQVNLLTLAARFCDNELPDDPQWLHTLLLGHGTDPCTVQPLGLSLGFVNDRQLDTVSSMVSHLVCHAPELHIRRCLLTLYVIGANEHPALLAIGATQLGLSFDPPLRMCTNFQLRQTLQQHYGPNAVSVLGNQWILVDTGDADFVLVTTEGFDLLVARRGPPSTGLLHAPADRNLPRDAAHLKRLLLGSNAAVVDQAQLDAVHGSDDPATVLELSLNLLYCLPRVPLASKRVYDEVHQHMQNLATIRRKYPDSPQMTVW